MDRSLPPVSRPRQVTSLTNLETFVRNEVRSFGAIKLENVTNEARLLCIKVIPTKARGREPPMFGTVALSEHPFVFLSFSATCTLSILQNVQKFLANCARN